MKIKLILEFAAWLKEHDTNSFDFKRLPWLLLHNTWIEQQECYGLSGYVYEYAPGLTGHEPLPGWDGCRNKICEIFGLDIYTYNALFLGKSYWVDVYGKGQQVLMDWIWDEILIGEQDTEGVIRNTINSVTLSWVTGRMITLANYLQQVEQ